MRDPHVERLHYDIGSGDGISYQDPLPLEFTKPLGHFIARDGNLIIEPAIHFASEAEGREAIEPFLHGWEIETDLTSNLGAIRFKFMRVELVDRDPPEPGEPKSVSLPVASAAVVAENASAKITRQKYPEPPSSFHLTPDVETVYQRWRGYKEGKEPLPAMAYFVLTMLAYVAGNRGEAAKEFVISRDVVRTLATLSSERGNAASARKMIKNLRDLSGPEKMWLERAVALLIRRMGEQAAGGQLVRITMSDLPTI